MSLFGSLFTWYLKKRISAVESFINHPIDVQHQLLMKLIDEAEHTEWGMKYGYQSIHSLRAYKERVPIGNYESFRPYIERMMRGEQNILWPSEVKWFAKSSGTTSTKSKFIPITYESLDECHFQGGRDALMLYCLNNPESKIFEGKSLVIGGSHQLNKSSDAESYFGDLSAVMMQNLPFWAHHFRTPDLSIAIMDNWDEKLEKMAIATASEDVTSISGVPTWTLMLIEKLFSITGKKSLHEIWPNLELYIHGGVGFTPYRDRFKKLIPQNHMQYMETYNASEGFIGIQDGKDDSLLLMLDYGIYYEFMPMSEYGKQHPATCSLEEVNTHTNYALVITTNSGLWRYILGDTIKFTSLHPFRFKITGRTKHYINAFGEELMIENADFAISKACEKLNALITDYTAAPVFHSEKNVGTHEWLIEFEKEPGCIDTFTHELDTHLKTVNSDYEAKRYNNIAMTKPIVRVLPKGTFHQWLKASGKLGGQHKVPRLSNTRHYVDDILGKHYTASSTA